MRETFGLIDNEEDCNRDHPQDKTFPKKQGNRNHQLSQDFSTSLKVYGPHPKYLRDGTEQQ